MLKMSLFVRQLSKLCARRASSCFFSSVPQSPYLMIDSGRKADVVETPNGLIVNPRLLDPTKKEASQIVCGGEMLIPDGFFCVGASKGWTMRSSLDRFYLTDGYKPWVSSPRCVPLPDTPERMPVNELVSISSSDPAQDDDIFVATKFHDSMLSVCRPRDSKWTHIESDCKGFLNSVFPASTIAYSKRYKAFYFTTPQGFNLSSVDLSNTDSYKLKCRRLRFRNIPKNIVAKWKVLHENCERTNHLLDSPSGDLFYIMWFTKVERVPSSEVGEDFYDDIKVIRTGPKQFMVFREDKKSKDFYYTEDIGDLCIFLGKNEAFCVSASMYPRLRPNSIYYTYPHRIGCTYPHPIDCPGLGCYSLASARTCRLTSHLLIHHGYFWIQPPDPVA